MALRDVILATQADLRANADHALATFSADSRQVEGLRSETKIRQFSLTVDEPPTLGGTDTGPNPVELVLAALATCQEITYRAYATALGIPLESVSVKLEGLLDLRGFFAVKDDVRAGFSEVRGVVNLKSSAPAAELAKLKEVVDAHCPVLDILRAPLPVDIRLEAEQATHAA
jgi:putative redox protein